ncbi:MAG TPA: hypothetical protein VGB66_07785 [Longimicrobium sp.]|jgi:hypothetical protein
MTRTYENSVFINCLFDPAYRPLLEAAAFATYECGFFPRASLEVDDSSPVRIEKITTIIRECRLAIHDISRTELDAATQLPRFNMPLELGIFLGAKSFGAKLHRRKAAIVLDTEPYRYQKFISDIAGQDIRPHGSQTTEVIRQVRDFLATHCDPEIVLPGGDKIAERYAAFREGARLTCSKFHLDADHLTFRDLTMVIVGWLRRHPLSMPAALPAGVAA